MKDWIEFMGRTALSIIGGVAVLMLVSLVVFAWGK